MARLLLIDDDDLVAATLRRHLERVGHEVVSVRHGGFGLKAFETQPFDMVITDILMPEIEGIETIRTLRRHDKTVPIVAITGGPVQNPVGASSGHDYLEMARLSARPKRHLSTTNDKVADG